MNPLQHRLDSLRRRLILVAFWRGACGLFALVVGAALFSCLADWEIHFPSAVRAFILVGIIGSAGYLAVRFVIMPLARRSDNLSLALRIEEVYPELNDLLGSSVQFMEQPAEEVQGSKVFRQRAVEEAEKRAENCDFNNIVDRRGVFLLPLAAILVGLGAAHFAYHHSGLTWTAACRLADPFGNHTWTRIAMAAPPQRIAQGQLFVIKGELGGIIPAQARLEVDGMVRLDKTLPVKRDFEQKSGAFMAQLDMTQQRTGKFRFRILANDASFPPRGAWHEIQVLPPPRLTMLDGLPSPQISLSFPAYTDLPSPRKLSAGQGHIDAVAGTHVTWRAAVDRPVSKAWLQMLPDNPLYKTALQLAPLGQMQPLDILGLVKLGQAVVGQENPCTIDEAGTLLTAEFIPWLPGSYWLHYQDADGLGNDYKHDLRIFPDPPPTVTLKRPGSTQSLLADAVVNLQMVVEDEIFAVRSVFLEYRRKAANGVWLDREPQRVPIMDPRFMSQEVPRLLSALAKSWVAGPDVRSRPTRLELTSRWPLLGKFNVGETVVFRVGADDFNDLFTPRAVGYSHDVELRIVGKTELAQQLDEDFAKVREEIVRLQTMQEQALQIIKDVQDERKKDPKGPLDKAQHDKVIEAEQLQKQLQERIGAKTDEGLRNELDKLKQKMNDNQLPGSDLKDRITTLTTELDRLVREDLQQIEAKLAEARKQPSGQPNKSATSPQKKDSLDQAKSLQEDARKTLDELAKFLDPWANLQQIKGETRKLLTQQKDMKKETDALNPKDKDFREDVRKKAEEENRLSAKAQDLMNTMKDMKDKQKGSETGQKVGEALKIAENADLPGKMSEIRDALKESFEKQQGLFNAGQKQGDVIKTLEKMLAALEKEKRDEELDKLRKKQKQAEKKLDQLAGEMDKLQKKIKDVNKIADPDKRAEELKNLVKEEEKLREKLQEEARELARLRADKASRDVAKAAQDLDQAGRKLQNGEDPGEAMQEAQEKLNQARADLEEAEEDLAREQLARVADRIKGLKERQDAAVAESERIHKAMERQKKWDNGLVRSLKDSSGSQKNLVQEAESVQEKLKDAKVFEHILKKAGQSMDKAADSILKQSDDIVARSRDEDNPRPIDAPLEKEELAFEGKIHEKTVKLQKEASNRLQRLLDALKQDPPPEKQAAKPMEGDQPKPMEGDEKPKPRAIPGDGIPGNAQIKALIEEQEEVKQNTKAFDERCPDRDNLTEEQQAELRALEQAQADIARLFQQLTNKNAEKGDDEP